MGGPAKPPLPAPINPFCPSFGLGPALSPSLRAFPPSRGCGGEGRKFPGSGASRALPPSSEPQPPAQLPADRSPDRGCPALGTRSSSESVASSSVALAPLSLLFSSRGPRARPHPGAFQARRPMLRPPATRGPGSCQSPGTDPAPFGPAVQPPPPSPGPAERRAAPPGAPGCAPRGVPDARRLCRSRSALGGPFGSSGAALAQMCWGPARAPVPSANSPDQTAPPAPSWRAPWRTPLAAAPGAAPARLERSGRPGDSRFLVPPTSGGGCGCGGGRYRELPPPPRPPRLVPPELTLTLPAWPAARGPRTKGARLGGGEILGNTVRGW